MVSFVCSPWRTCTCTPHAVRGGTCLVAVSLAVHNSIHGFRRDSFRLRC
jgi:hypothetical protein